MNIAINEAEEKHVIVCVNILQNTLDLWYNDIEYSEKLYPCELFNELTGKKY